MKILADINKKTIGKMIRDYRVKVLDITQKQLAQKVEKSVTDIGQYERGINMAPSIVTEKLRFMVKQYKKFNSESDYL